MVGVAPAYCYSLITTSNQGGGPAERVRVIVGRWARLLGEQLDILSFTMSKSADFTVQNVANFSAK
jgi:hypothetical protein